MAFLAPLLPLAASAAAGYIGHRVARRHERGAERHQAERMGRISKKDQRRSLKDQVKFIKKQYQLAEKYGLPRKYVEEKFFKKPTISKGQKGLLDFLTKEALNLPRSQKLEKSDLYKVGAQNLQNILQGQLEQSPYFQQAGQGLLGLLQNPLQQNPLYQGATQNLQDLLSNNPQAYADFAAPHLREFREQILPGIAEQYAGKGASSGLQSQVAAAGAGLAEKLAAMRRGLQQSALDRALGYSQAPFETGLATARTALPFAQAPVETRLQALNPAFQYAQQPIVNRQQQIENALNTAKLSLGVQPFENIYRPAQYHAFSAPGSQFSSPVQIGGQRGPGFFGQIGGALASGVGQAAGSSLGSALGSRLTNFFGGGGAASPAISSGLQGLNFNFLG